MEEKILFLMAARAVELEACEEWQKKLSETGDYKLLTTFWGRLAVAEEFRDASVAGCPGEDHGWFIRRTYEQALGHFTSYEEMTEVVMALNHRIWMHYGKDDELALLYSDLWREAEDLFYERYSSDPDAVLYYHRVTD